MDETQEESVAWLADLGRMSQGSDGELGYGTKLDLDTLLRMKEEREAERGRSAERGKGA